MGTRIVVGHADHGQGQSVAYLYDSVTGWAFGPQFGSLEEASDFLDWLERNGRPDPRTMSENDLYTAVQRWRTEMEKGVTIMTRPTCGNLVCDGEAELERDLEFRGRSVKQLRCGPCAELGAHRQEFRPIEDVEVVA